MSRQYNGEYLKAEARTWLYQNVELTEGSESHKCPICGDLHGEVPEELVVVSTLLHDAWFGEGPVLHTYRLKTGGTVCEIVQQEPWSGGPYCFLCLELESDGTRLFEWSLKEIDEYL